MRTSIFKYLISTVILICGINAGAASYVSLSPVTTEIIYALDAQENLKGVSTTCNFPAEAKQKPIIGDTYYVNMEMMVKLKPDYLFAMTSAKPKLGELAMTNTKPIYFEFTKIDDIYTAINDIAEITEKKTNAEQLINHIKEEIEKSKTKTPKRILYIIQTNPLITIGNKSFINDIISKSGHISVTNNINHYYPAITLEYAMKTNPEIIIICFPSDTDRIKRMFPDSQFLYLNSETRDIINRSGPRVYESVKLFADLNFNTQPQD